MCTLFDKTQHMSCELVYRHYNYIFIIKIPGGQSINCLSMDYA